MKRLLISGTVLLLLATTACATPGGAPGGAPDPGAPEGGSPTACVEGDWNADIPDLSAQLLEHLSSNGVPVVSVNGTGTQQLSLDEQGYAGYDTDLTLVIVADLDDGLVLTVTQSHDGTMRSNWGWDSDTRFGFTDIVDEGLSVSTTADINGRSVEYPMDVPLGGLSEVPLTVTCDGDTMTTKAEQSPFTTTWHRI